MRLISGIYDAIQIFIRTNINLMIKQKYDIRHIFRFSKMHMLLKNLDQMDALDVTLPEPSIPHMLY